MRRLGILASWILFATALTGHAPLWAQEPDSSVPEAPAAIPVTQVAERARETHVVLSRVREQLTPPPEIVAIERDAHALLDSLAVMRSDSAYVDLSVLTARKLNTLSQQWAIYIRQIETWEASLKARVATLAEADATLKAEHKMWTATSEEAREGEAPEAVIARTISVLANIDSLQTRLDERGSLLLTLSDRLASDQVATATLAERIADAEARRRTSLFVLDSPPLWQELPQLGDASDWREKLVDTWREMLALNGAFIRANRGTVYVHIAVFILLTTLIIYLRFRLKRQPALDAEDDSLKASMFFISHPVSAALLVALALTPWMYPTRPDAVGEFALLLILVPIVRLIPSLVAAELRRPFLILAGLYVLDLIQNLFADQPTLRRILLFVLTSLLSAIFAWWLRPRGLVWTVRNKLTKAWWPPLAPLVLFLAVVSTIANIVGAVALSHQLAVGVLEGLVIASILFATTRVTAGLLALCVRGPGAAHSYLLRLHGTTIERAGARIVKLAAIFAWFQVMFRRWGVQRSFLDWVDGVLAHKWRLGAAEISLESVLGLVITLTLTFLLARFTRTLLDIEVFPRFRLPRGIPGAISMMVRYAIVGFGVFLAISAAGVDLGKFGLLAGAMGVGLGFGLRNIIENFVSGLIVAFERPVQVGDTVEIGAVMGKVAQIGVRSCTVETFDGSEVMVPNAEMISSQVTNWTLSAPKRRAQLPVKVAFGTNPHEVIAILEGVTREHTGVLKFPEPMATYNGFGDYYLEFTLYYWITDNILQTKSEVALGVHDAISTAGIATPTPQGDFKLQLTDRPRGGAQNKLDLDQRTED